ncbi:MAG: hypothetical protein JWM57_3691, partial [Phycisphaerales bacterium]|nr:hypothetical protein [Phycisphaerales bacterium]
MSSTARSTATVKPTSPVGPGLPGYSVSRPAGKCAISGIDIHPGDTFMAILKDTPMGLERLDVSLAHWPEVNAAEGLAYWRAVMPQPDAVKKKPFVDDEVLTQLFERLADTDEPHKVHFRFVLGLILMRKRLLVYEASDHVDGHDVWIVRRKGNPEKLTLRNPHLTEEQ